MENKIHLPIINGFEINLILKESKMLIIDAKNCSTYKQYSVNISENILGILTGELFSDVESLYDSLLDGINNKDSSIKVNLTDNAVLNCCVETLIGKKKKIFEFPIPLIQIESNPIINLQNIVSNLKKKIDKKDERISLLEQENKNLIITLQTSLDSDNQKQTDTRRILEIENQIHNIESRLVSEIEKQTLNLYTKLSSDLKNQTLTLSNILYNEMPILVESSIRSEIKRQDVTLSTTLSSELEKFGEQRLFSEMKRQSQLLHTKIGSDIENHNKTFLITELEKQTEIFKTYLVDNNKKQINNGFLEIDELVKSKVLLEFDIKSINSSNFYFTNNNQTIIYKNNNSWKMIHCNKPLPKNKISIDFKIESSKLYRIMIGICPISNLNQTGSCYNFNGTYTYYGHNGRVYYNSSYIDSKGGAFKKDSIITMTVNLLDYTIEWIQDNELMHKMNLDKSYLNEELYACIHLLDRNDSVCLLN